MGALILSALILLLYTSPQEAQSVGRCTGLDNYAGDLVFAGHSNYCASHLGYMKCDFQCSPKPVAVEENYPSVHPLLLEYAPRLQIPPVCVSWITVRTSARVLTIRGSRASEHCGYWLRLENSEALRLDHGIVDLSVKDSEIGSISLPRLRQLNIYNSSIRSIDHADIIMYPSSILKSQIQDIFFINVTVTDFKITDTVIDTIGPGSIIFNGENLVFENVLIRKLKNRAINMLSGKLLMKNCSINDITESAIIADDSKIILSDVTIERMEAPAFHFDTTAEIIHTNVTVGGQLIRSISKYIRYPPVTEAIDKETVVITGFSNEYCKFELGILDCDFTNVNRPVTFESNALPIQLTINITNANMLRAVGDFSCAHINIINCTGKFVSLPRSTCSSVGKLLVTESNLTSISTKKASRITINSSSVTTLHATSAKFLEVTQSNIRTVYDVMVERELKCMRSHLLEVTSAQLRGSGSIHDCKFDAVSSLELTPGEGSVSITNASINSLPQKSSILVKDGLVSMENVVFDEAAPASIYLEDEARLTLSNVSFDLSVYGVISTHEFHQVSFNADEGDDFIFLTQQRSRGEVRQNWPVPPGAFIADAGEGHCTETAARLDCDYSHVSEAVVVVTSNASEVTLERASSVILRPVGTQFVAVNEVSSLTVERKQSDAALDVLAINSSFENLTAVVHSFILDSCSVNSFFLPPNHMMMSFTARSSQMSELVVQTQLAFFTFSKIGNVRLLTGDSLLIRNSSIDKISPAGLVVGRDGFIDSAVIDYLDEKSVIIHGKFTVQNTSISNVVENSIVVHVSGSIIIQNVSIENSSKCPIMILGQITHVSDLRINGVHINSATSFLRYCGVDGPDHLGSMSSDWDQEENENKKKLLLGVALSAMMSLFAVAAVLVIVRSCRPGRRALLPLVSWRSSSETVVYSGLAQTYQPPRAPADDDHSERSRLVENEDD